MRFVVGSVPASREWSVIFDAVSKAFGSSSTHRATVYRLESCESLHQRDSSGAGHLSGVLRHGADGSWTTGGPSWPMTRARSTHFEHPTTGLLSPVPSRVRTQ